MNNSNVATNLDQLPDVRLNIEQGVYTNRDPWPTLPEERLLWKMKARLREQLFRTDALMVLGIDHHPNAQRAFDIAWSHNHGYGLGEVFDMLEELASLLR